MARYVANNQHPATARICTQLARNAQPYKSHNVHANQHLHRSATQCRQPHHECPCRQEHQATAYKARDHTLCQPHLVSHKQLILQCGDTRSALSIVLHRQSPQRRYYRSRQATDSAAESPQFAPA